MLQQKSLFINILLWVSRIVFGSVFIFSGFVKMVDPLGSTYKFEDYFLSFGMEWMFFSALPAAIFMSVLEFIIGIAIILGLNMRLSSLGGLLFMGFFTPLTLYIALADPVSDCGCFGDAFIVSNWETFYKNIFLLGMAIFIFIKRKDIKPLFSFKTDTIVLSGFGLASIFFSIYCLINLPVIDFRPWKIGNYMPDMMKEKKSAVIERFYVYENKDSGEKQTISEDEIMKGNVPSAEEWNFVSREENVLEEGIPAPISNFEIHDEYGDDYTEFYLSYPDNIFIVVAYDLNKTNIKSFKDKLIPILENSNANDIPVVFLTSSLDSEIIEFNKKLDKDISFYQSEERELKTIIRSNPGLVLMKDGFVIDKWAYSNIPEFTDISKEHFN
jgi:uncharacterized membrane protein YphA (DoxX/SURF4 family)